MIGKHHPGYVDPDRADIANPVTADDLIDAIEVIGEAGVEVLFEIPARRPLIDMYMGMAAEEVDSW